MRRMKRILALLLAAMLLLSACGKGEKAKPVETTEEFTQPEEQHQILPPQKEMPREELEQLLYRAEYAALAAAIARDEMNFMLDWYVISERYGYVGDVDRDGIPELVYSRDALQFDLSEGKNATYQWEQSGNDMYTANDGAFYLLAGVGDIYEEYDSQYGYVSNTYSDRWYREWNGTEWETVITTASETSHVILSQDPYQLAPEPLKRSFSSEVYGQSMGEAEFESYMGKRGITQVTSRVDTYTTVRCDAAYTDSVLDALDDHLKESYGTYTGRITGDFDDDGFRESIFLIHDIYAPWVESIYQYAGNLDALPWVLESTINADVSRTTLLLADVRGDQLVIQTADCSGQLRAQPDSVEYREGSLWIDGIACYVSGTDSPLEELDYNARDSVYAGICNLLSGYGFTNTTIKLADITDMDGTDLLCICQKGSEWYLIIFVLCDGAVIPVDYVDLSNHACYLAEYEGKEYLLRYSQSVDSAMGGGYWTYYDYNLMRYGERGQYVSKDSQALYYHSSEKKADQVAAFFDRMNRYLTHVTVLRDSYALLGQKWILREESDYTERSNSNIEDEDVEGKLGFVQISDPGSWLNLREGPGTQYDRVLMTPGDPNSFVRQALGAPVTVLETIETGDEDNPVWLRIRIRYGDREIEGYSSAKYIRMQDE